MYCHSIAQTSNGEGEMLMNDHSGSGLHSWHGVTSCVSTDAPKRRAPFGPMLTSFTHHCDSNLSHTPPSSTASTSAKQQVPLHWFQRQLCGNSMSAKTFSQGWYTLSCQTLIAVSWNSAAVLHELFVPVSLAASPLGNGSLHESSAEGAEIRIVFGAQCDLRLWNPLEIPRWLHGGETSTRFATAAEEWRGGTEGGRVRLGRLHTAGRRSRGVKGGGALAAKEHMCVYNPIPL